MNYHDCVEIFITKKIGWSSCTENITWYIHSMPSIEGSGKSASWHLVESIRALAFIRVSDIRPKSWPVAFLQLDTLFKFRKLWCISCSLSISPNPISRPDTVPGHFQWYVGPSQLWASCPPPLLSRGHLLFSLRNRLARAFACSYHC